MINRMRDLDIQQHEDGGFRVISVNHYIGRDDLNLPAYRFSHTIIVRWEDAACKRPLAEAFDGWANSHEAAQAEAARKYAEWNAKMQSISAWTCQRRAVQS
jgi:hypothetical protein